MTERLSKNLYCGPVVLRHLARYEWPGNIRQLENVLRRLVLSSTGSEISPDSVVKVLEAESAIGSYFKPSASGPPGTPMDDPAESRLSISKMLNVGDPQARPYGWVSADERGSIEGAL